MVLGDAAADPNPAQLDAMRGVVRRAMDEGAMGVASALIYPPGTFAGTPELVAIAGAAARCGGVYATHLRSEGDRFLESVDEALRSEEHTSELQSLMRISYAVFCLKKKKRRIHRKTSHQ